MSFSYGFFNAQLTSDGGYDRVYTAENFAEYFHLFVGNGVFADPATSLQVISSLPASMNVVVSAGYGWINGYYAKNTDEYPLTLNVAHASLPRYDAVVLRWVNETRSMELAVLTGLAAASPVVPTLTRNTEVYELMLAAIRVEAGATNITQSAITDKRPDNTVCGWVTSLIDQIDTTNLFAQYNAEFTEWFDNIKAQLEGNVATNLQNQINERLKIADKATVAEAQAGTNDTHYMTPDKVDDFYQAHKATTAEAQAGTNTNKFLTPATAYQEILSKGTKIEVGSYMGTGTYGASNPNSITCSFAPKLVMITYLYFPVHQKYTFLQSGYSTSVFIMDSSTLTNSYTDGTGFRSTNSVSSYGKKDGNRIFWYMAGSNNASFQLNDKDVVYHYVAIG